MRSFSIVPALLGLFGAGALLAGLAPDSRPAPPTADHAEHAMSDAAMAEALAAWFAEHPRHGRERYPGTIAGAPVDTFFAYSTPSFRFDSDGDLAGTPRDSTTIFVGESIRWQLVNGSHTVTSGIPFAPDAGDLFNADLNSVEPEFTFTYESEGRYPFFCSVHTSTMRGVINVQSLVGVEPLPLPAGTPVRGFLKHPGPNPASDFVVVRFALAEPGRARLDVLDARGRRVARLVDGTYEAGGYAVKWERGREGGGGRAPAGVYFLRLTVPGAVQNERIVITE